MAKPIFIVRAKVEWEVIRIEPSGREMVAAICESEKRAVELVYEFLEEEGQIKKKPKIKKD